MSVLKSFRTMGRSGCIEIFDSAQEVVRVSAERKNTDSRFHDYRNGYEVERDWCGVDSYEHALELLKTGYQPIVDTMKSSLKVGVTGEMKRISFRNDVVGFQPVVPLAMQGVPNCMVNSYMKPIKSKVLNICYDSTASAMTDSEDIIDAGKKMLSALIKLEMQGYRFNLYAMQSYNRDRQSYIMCAKVKSANTAIDLKRISFPIAHTGFLRVIGFDWYGRCPLAKYLDSYGCALKYEMETDKISDMMSELMGEKVLYFSATEIIKEGEQEIMEAIKDGKSKV